MGLEPQGRRGLRRIVCDAAPLLSLQEADLLEILPLAGRISIPPAVETELQTLDPIPEWVEVVSLDASFAHEALTWIRSGILDPGESEAMALVRQLDADWLLTDDAAARLVAQREEIEATIAVEVDPAGIDPASLPSRLLARAISVVISIARQGQGRGRDGGCDGQSGQGA